MRAIDFFCGAGGLTRGLTKAGIDVQLGVDIDGACRETYERNNGGAQFIGKDITKITSAEIRARLGRTKSSDLLLAACAPCQPFAQLNRIEGIAQRRRLLRHTLRFVEDLRPRFVLIENVPGLRRVDGFSTYRRFFSTLTSLGYSVAAGVLDAKSFGVPQTRRRLLVLAVKGNKAIALPSPTYGSHLTPFQTVRDAISHYPPLCAGETHSQIPNHRAAGLSALNLSRIQQTPRDGGSRVDWPSRIWLACHSGGFKGHTDSYGRMRWDEPAPTLTCRCHSLSNGRYGHPEQDRAISLREAARLQGFSDDYLFHGPSAAHLATQIGNAVPVPIAEALGTHLMSL